jgi:hypothetical protein
MRYRWSRKPPASFISLILSTPRLIISSQTSRRDGMTVASTVLDVTVASTQPCRGTVTAVETSKRWSRTRSPFAGWIRSASVRAPNAQGVDSAGEPAG